MKTKYIKHDGLLIPPDFILIASSSHRQYDCLRSIPDAVAVRSGPYDTTCPYLDCTQPAFIIREAYRELALRVKGARQIKRSRYLLFYGGWGTANDYAETAKRLNIVEYERRSKDTKTAGEA